ncbi:MAG: hypothetical protein H6915_09240 [Novosphingobium sp.]|nr:hypothetical protein [Novosphingobium sp.]MCP5379274.1 hypothetical protein [Novosphingobium sp.]MCP5389936.1 hypothetical protein [Novosphingobium sp.]
MVETPYTGLRMPEDELDPVEPAYSSGRAEVMKRLQIGLVGLGAMLLMVALANVVMDRAKESDATTVPEAAATVEAKPSTPAVADPLVDVGVVPEMPAAPAAGAAPPTKPARTGTTGNAAP